MVIRTPAEGTSLYRGPRYRLPVTWEQRCKNHLHGALKKKDENGRYKFTSITDRYQKDPRYVTALNEEFQKEFGRDSTLDDAVEMDELANGETTASRARWYINQLPQEERGV